MEKGSQKGYKEDDIPDDVHSLRMQRFDGVLNFKLRAVNQKKSNRDDNYELDRLSRYMKDLVVQNVKYASECVKS